MMPRQFMYFSKHIPLFFITSVLLFQSITFSHADMIQPPPPSVAVETINYEKTRTWRNFSGTLTAVNAAEIKPQVSGEIKQVLFTDGQTVEKDQLLFVIDPRPYEAELNRIKAQLASAKSRLVLASDELERKRKLVASKLVSESVYDVALNEFQMATVAVDEAKSAVSEAEINVDYAYIRAPFNGIISRAELTVGNVVDSQMNQPVLASVVATEKLYAEFNVDERTYIKAKRQDASVSTMPVELTLSDDVVVYHGVIHSFDNQLDRSSGTIRARAIFDNTDGVLTPGMFANIRLGSAEQSDVILIPQKAVGTNQNKKFVYVIDESNTAQYREVTLGEHQDDKRVVLSGLNPGEQIIVNGLSHIRPNTVVSPQSESIADESAN
jgi:multidrug efflux system membrane fusion protein